MAENKDILKDSSPILDKENKIKKKDEDIAVKPTNTIEVIEQPKKQQIIKKKNKGVVISVSKYHIIIKNDKNHGIRINGNFNVNIGDTFEY